MPSAKRNINRPRPTDGRAVGSLAGLGDKNLSSTSSNLECLPGEATVRVVRRGRNLADKLSSVRA
jgi:hypothetical protein